MQPNSKYIKYKEILDEINLKDEDGYVETHKIKLHTEFKRKDKLTEENEKTSSKNNVWFSTVEKYLNSVEYAFDKGNSTGKKVSIALDNIPEPTSKKFVVRFTIGFVLIVLIIFFTSCKANAQVVPSPGAIPLPVKQAEMFDPNSTKQDKNENTENSKGQERLFIKRENLQIKLKEPGSSSGSIWADSSQPKSLSTEYQPTRAGEVITVTIPDDLQYKPAADQASGSTDQKFDPVKSLKFEIVGFEPGGDVYLRGSKTYVNESGEQRSVMVMAKMPQRSLNKFEVDAKELTQVAVNSKINGASSDYSSAGWDVTTSRKVSGFAPDLNSAIASLDGQKKEMDIQQKALKDQQKALAEEADRLKKDRNRLNAETAQARQLLDSATIMDPPAEDGKNAKSGSGAGASSGTGGAAAGGAGKSQSGGGNQNSSNAAKKPGT